MSNPDRPKTLYELCEQTAEAIELAPETYNQDYFIHNTSKDEEAYLREGSCGTSFCRAGWMYVLLQSEPLTPANITRLTCDTSLIYQPVERLFKKAGIPYEELDALFGAAANDDEDLEDRWDQYKYHTDIHNYQPGTKAYAKEGAKGLREFMHKYEDELRAASLIPLRRRILSLLPQIVR